MELNSAPWGSAWLRGAERRRSADPSPAPRRRPGALRLLPRLNAAPVERRSVGQRSVRRRPSLPQISRHACRAPTRPYFPALKSALSEKSTRAAGGAATERRSAGRDGAGRARRCAALCRAVRRCAGRGCRCVGRGDGAALRAVGLGGGLLGRGGHRLDLGGTAGAERAAGTWGAMLRLGVIDGTGGALMGF